jgi:hypothetical protein
VEDDNDNSNTQRGIDNLNAVVFSVSPVSLESAPYEAARGKTRGAGHKHNSSYEQQVTRKETTSAGGKRELGLGNAKVLVPSSFTVLLALDG